MVGPHGSIALGQLIGSKVSREEVSRGVSLRGRLEMELTFGALMGEIVRRLVVTWSRGPVPRQLQALELFPRNLLEDEVT